MYFHINNSRQLFFMPTFTKQYLGNTCDNLRHIPLQNSMIRYTSCTNRESTRCMR